MTENYAKQLREASGTVENFSFFPDILVILPKKRVAKAFFPKKA